MQILKNTTTSTLELSQPKNDRRKFTGQGMVEFALVLPLLLLIVYGLLETGRLLFIYGSTVTAARQAARYGSASGLSENGVPYYRDCTGIVGAVNNVAFIHTYDNIHITYDRGLDNSGTVISIPGINSSPTSDTCNAIGDDKLRSGDRIKVQVSTNWQPIIAIVPSWQGFTITSAAERTILRSIAIGVDPEASNWVPGSSMVLSVSPSPTTFSASGQTITFTYTVQNNGNVTLTGPFFITDTISTVSCGGAPASLLIGQTFSCTGTYTTSQADVLNGLVTTNVTAGATETVSNTVGVTVNLVQVVELLLTKSAAPTIATNIGATVSYTYTLKNTGTATLTSPYTITDNKIPSDQIDCSSAASPLTPGSSTTCTASYTITATDISNGLVTNVASATAKYNINSTVTSNSASASVNTTPLALSVQATLTTLDAPTNIQQRIDYIYTLQNVGTVDLYAPYGVTNSLAVTNINCPSSSTLSPGATTTCTSEYLITQADRDADTGVAINSARASANSGAVLSNPASSTTTIPITTMLALTVVPSTTLATNLNDPITYTYTIRNDSNITVDAPFVVSENGIAGTPSCSVATGSLLPQATATCTIAYNVTQTDLNAGSILNYGLVAAQHDGIAIPSSAALATVITYNAPRITLSLESNPVDFSAAGQSLNFTFKLRNTGNANVTGPYTVTLSAPTGITVTCPGTPSPLTLGQSVTCISSAYYTTTAANVTALQVPIQASATATSLSATLNTSVPYFFGCTVYHSAAPVFTFGSQTMQMNVISSINTAGTIAIKSINLSNMNLTTHPQQRITSITYGGVTIWTGNSGQLSSPPPFNVFTGDVTLGVGQNKYLVFNFNRDYTPSGTERLVIAFTQAGCPNLDSSNSAQVQ